MLNGGVGADGLDGDTGTDIVDYTGRAAAVTVRLTDHERFGLPVHAGNAEDETNWDGTYGDSLTAIEGAVGGAGDDVLVGDRARTRSYRTRGHLSR